MTEAADEVLLLGDWLSWNPESLPTSAWNQHVPLAAWLFEKHAPRLSLELGGGAGDSFRALCQIAARFGDGGRFVGIDPWKSDPQAPWLGNSVYDSLREYGATRYPDTASLLRMELDEAVSQFDDGSVDFLHIAGVSHPIDASTWDPALWMPKMRSGGIILVTNPHDDGLDEAPRKVWQQLAEWYPSLTVGLPPFVGIAQVPLEGRAPIVDFLRAGSSGVSTLFRLLGERIDYRHVLGSDPVSSTGLRRHISGILDDHADRVRSSEERHQLAIEARDRQLASVYERLLVRSREVGELQSEGDFLLAKLATQSALHEQEVAELRSRSAIERAALESQLDQHVAGTSALHVVVAQRDDYIQAMMNRALGGSPSPFG